MGRGRARRPYAVDALDARIIRLLQADGRLPNTEIARRLGVAEATVRNRVERLLREGVIQVGAWADPLKIGYQNYAMIELQVKPPYIVSVAERLARMPEFYFVGICTGAFDIYAGAVIRSVADMEALITRRLARVPGIVRTSTSSIIRLVKRDYSYPVPGFENEAGFRGRAGPGRGRRPRGDGRRRGVRRAGARRGIAGAPAPRDGAARRAGGSPPAVRGVRAPGAAQVAGSASGAPRPGRAAGVGRRAHRTGGPGSGAGRAAGPGVPRVAGRRATAGPAALTAAGAPRAAGVGAGTPRAAGGAAGAGAGGLRGRGRPGGPEARG